MEDRKAALDALKEKRWALYVARAVDRFQDWWAKVLVPREGRARVTCRQLASEPDAQKFAELGNPLPWTSSELPPLGRYYIVWHELSLTLSRCAYGLAHFHAEPTRLLSRLCQV